MVGCASLKHMICLKDSKEDSFICLMMHHFQKEIEFSTNYQLKCRLISSINFIRHPINNYIARIIIWVIHNNYLNSFNYSFIAYKFYINSAIRGH